MATPGQNEQLLRNLRMHRGLINGQLAVVIPAQQRGQRGSAHGTVHTGDASRTVHERNQTSELASDALRGRCVRVVMTGRRTHGWMNAAISHGTASAAYQ